MIFEFNKAQLGAVMEKELDSLLLEIQKTQADEITVRTSAGGFPYKLVISASGVSANLLWDHVKQRFEVIADPLPVTKSVDEVKEFHRPEITVTVNSVVAQFMGLPVEQRPAFFAEVWKTISSEVKG